MLLKRYLSIALFFIGLIAITPTVNAFFYEDMADIPQWAIDATEDLKKQKIMTGFGDGTFRPDNELNRAQALVLILRTKEIDYAQSVRGTIDANFTDVPDDAWFSKAVNEGVSRKWIKGFPDGTFGPGNAINRAEFAIMLKRAFGMDREEDPQYLDVPTNTWFSSPIFCLAANDLIRERGTDHYNPSDIVTRADAAWMMSQILRKPRLMGESKANDFSMRMKRDARKVAIKPRNFDANNQGVDVERKGIYVSVGEGGKDLKLSGEDDWLALGTLLFQNKLDSPVQVHSFELKLRFEQSNIGPVSSFTIKLTDSKGNVREIPLDRTGRAIVPGIDQNIDIGHAAPFNVEIKANPGDYLFVHSGEGILSIEEIGASIISASDMTRKVSVTTFKHAPIKFEERNLVPFEFKPYEN